MILPVLTHRQTKLEPSEGTLKAWVVQEGQRGAQLLTGRFMDVEQTKIAILRRLQKDVPGCMIQWTVEDYREIA
jgi:hypothetical protein